MTMLLLVLALIVWSPSAAGAGDAAAGPAGVTRAEVLRLGQRMYREGLLPDGTPMKALAAGDMLVDGRMFTCAHCHRRSGLGSAEGTVVAWPIAGKALWEPRRRTGAWRPPDDERGRTHGRRSLPRQHQAPDARPAYTEGRLARALREGVDPTGRTLHPVMPRYALGDRDLAILIEYLRNLSAEPSPGVDATTLRFATVVSDGVPFDERDAMLGILQAYVDAHNAQSRREERRAKWGPFVHSEMNLRYRRLELDRWELTGPRETWRSQLEDHYRKRPVFGLLGGMARGSWEPIHRFCEENRIPCLFPMTDLPVVSAEDWYTVYFSKGLYQEGETAASYLHESGRVGPDTRIVQVVGRGDREAALARGFREAWARTGGTRVIERPLDQGGDIDRLVLETAASRQPTVLVLWLDMPALDVVGRIAQVSSPPAMSFLSSTLLGGRAARIPDSLRDVVYLTYPESLPHESKPRRSALETALRAKNIPIIRLPVQARTWFLGTVLSRVLREMRSDAFHRDYFLERTEMMANQESGVVMYPQLTLGPDQRYASKGCYIVQLTPGPDPQLVKRSEWVTH